MEQSNIKTIVLGMVMTNCYIISNSELKEAFVIDPGDQADKIIGYLKKNDLVCKGILLTHGHFDHIMAVNELSESTKAPVYIHEEEAELVKNPSLNCSSHIRADYRVEPNVLILDQQILELAGYSIKVIHTPGHTGGGVCFYLVGQGVLFSGDTLFRDSIGRTDLPTGNGRKLIQSIMEKLMVMEDQVRVYPGHGEYTTIGYERESNIYLSRNAEDFFNR